MILQSKQIGRCKKCGMFIEPGDWIKIAPDGAILECMFDDEQIRQHVRDKEREDFIKRVGEDFLELVRPEKKKDK